MSEVLANRFTNIEDRLSLNKEEVLKDIFNAYSNRIYKFFIYRVNNPHLAEELTSVVFEKVVVNISSYNKNKSSLDAWIFTIARNSMYDYFRTRKSYNPIDDYQDTLVARENVEEKIGQRESKKDLINLLEDLDDRERSIISYKFGGGLQNKEIAEIMDLTPTNVGSILYRSLKKLKGLLEVDKDEE